MKSYDVAVIGLGAVGSAALYQLSKTNNNVIGIDRFSPPHTHGSSHGESRVTRQAIGEGTYYVPVVQRANKIWKELEKLSGKELFNACGTLIIYDQESEFLNNMFTAAKSFNIEHQVLDKVQVENKFPALHLNAHETGYYEPGSGFLRPEACIEVQLKAAVDNGAETMLNTKVTIIKEDKTGIIIKTENGSVITNKVIITSGPWISDFLPPKLKSLFKTYYQTLYWFDIDQRYSSQLQPGTLPVLMAKLSRLEGPPHYSIYGMPVAGGTTGGIKFAIHDIPPEVSPDLKDEVEPVQGAAQLLYKNVSKLVKHIKPSVLRSANCVYTVTPDEDFIIDYLPGSSKIIIGSACSGHGFKHSAATGEALAQLAVSEQTELDIRAFSFSRFQPER